MTSRPPRREPRAGPVIEIAVSGHSLKKMDPLSLSDPFVVLYVKGGPVYEGNCKVVESRLSSVTPRDASWVYYGETEVVWDSMSPKFSRRLFVSDDPTRSMYGPHTELRFEVYDADTTDVSSPLASHDFMGSCTVSYQTLGDVGSFVFELANKKLKSKCGALGLLVLTLERYTLPSGPERPLQMKVSFAKICQLPPDERIMYSLVRKAMPRTTGGRRPSKLTGISKDWVVVYRSGTLHLPRESSTVEPFAFQPAELTLLALTGNDEDRPLALELFLHQPHGNHVLVGRSQPFTVRMLKTGTNGGKYGIKAPGSSEKGKGSESSGSDAIVGGSVSVIGQFIPEPEGNEAIAVCGNETLSNTLGRSVSLLRGVGSMSLEHSSSNILTVEVLDLVWVFRKKGFFDRAEKGIQDALKIRNARV